MMSPLLLFGESLHGVRTRLTYSIIGCAVAPEATSRPLTRGTTGRAVPEATTLAQGAPGTEQRCAIHGTRMRSPRPNSGSASFENMITAMAPVCAWDIL